MPRVAIVDDDRNILSSIAILLESVNIKVDTYTDGTSALPAFIENPPDLAIVDLKMPRISGFDLLERLRESSDLPVIILTSRDSEEDEVRGLKLGADDFLRKPFSQRILLERVRTVLRRSTARVRQKPDDGVMEQGNILLDRERHICTWKGKPVLLTVTEFAIVDALAQRPGVVKSRDALLDAAYDDETFVDDRSIDTHVKRIRGKFREAEPEFDGIETLYGLGYRFSA